MIQRMTDSLGATQGQTCANHQLHDLHGMNQPKPLAQNLVRSL